MYWRTIAKMSFSIPKFPMFATISPNTPTFSSNFPQLPFSYPHFSTSSAKFGCRYGFLRCYAAAKQPKSGGAPPPTATTKKKRKPPSKSSSKKLVGDDFEIEKNGDGVEVLESPSESAQSSYPALPLPKPPAGFVLDEQGRVLMASNKRIATIVRFSNVLFLSFYICMRCIWLITCDYSLVFSLGEGVDLLLGFRFKRREMTL